MDLASASELHIDDLLEDYWFFENLFSRSCRVLRYCHSDPYPSSSDSEKILEPSLDRVEGGSHEKKLVGLRKSGSRSAPGKIQEERCLIRAPSLPLRIEKREKKLARQFSEKIKALEPTTRHGESFLQKKEVMVREKDQISTRNKTGSNSLQRTQTMPNKMTRQEDNVEDEFEDQESCSRMGFLIREALTSSHIVQEVSSNHRQSRPPINLRSEETVMVNQGSSGPKTLRKTLSNIEPHTEIQRLNDCYDQLTEPRVRTRVATPPRVPKDSRKEMKDQIKFWARAVASNVRQEC